MMDGEKMILETERMILRPVVPADADDIFAYSSEPNVGPSAGWKVHETMQETLEVMDAFFLNNSEVFGMVLKSSGRLIGTVGFREDPKRHNPVCRMLGYAMSESCWGRGLMPEAAEAVVRYGFSELGLDLISAYCYPDNLRSSHVLEKTGLEYEGILHHGELRWDGVMKDEECYYLTRQRYYDFRV
jgi:ribosomal-protein-alanine N-acetyltransferase